MNRVIFNNLPNISTPYELIDAIRKEPSLIFDALGYCNEDVLNDAEIVCFETKLNIPKVDASDLNEALNITSLKYDDIHFFEFDGMTFPSIKKETFDALPIDEKQSYVDHLMDALILSKVEVKRLVLWSMSNLATIGISDWSEMIDPGLSDATYFNERIYEGNNIDFISFEPKEEESEAYFTFLDHQELEPNILVNLPESIIFEAEDYQNLPLEDSNDMGDMADDIDFDDENVGFYWQNDSETSMDGDDENDFLEIWDLV